MLCRLRKKEILLELATTNKKDKNKPIKLRQKRQQPSAPCKSKKTSLGSVFVKTEPLERERNVVKEITYCRCCFKMLNVSESQISVNEDSQRTFQEIIQMEFYPSHLASSFCEGCFIDIQEFTQFKKLAAARQSKFNEILCGEVGDLNEIHEFKLLSDPLHSIVTMVAKEEEERETVEEELVELLQPEPIEDGRSKRIRTAIKQQPKVNVKKDDKYKQCPHCSVKAFNLNRHIIHRHLVKCSSCKYETTDQSKLDLHIKKNHPMLVKCPICKRSLKGSVQKHIENVHNRAKNFWCDLCKYSSFGRRQLINHMTWHLAKNIFCEQCDYSTVTIGRLHGHVKRKHETAPEETGVNPCPECNATFVKKSFLQTHISRNHEKRRDYPCSDCDLKFFQRNEMILHHSNNHVEAKTEICEICGKSFGTPIALKHHKLLHGERQHACHLCDMKFILPARLKSHIDCFHLKLRPHQCEECGQAFFKKDKLKIHKLKHVGIKFACFVPGCSSTVTRKDNLVFHMKHSHSLTAEAENDYMEKLNAFCATLKKNKYQSLDRHEDSGKA